MPYSSDMAFQELMESIVSKWAEKKILVLVGESSEDAVYSREDTVVNLLYIAPRQPSHSKATYLTLDNFELPAAITSKWNAYEQIKSKGDQADFLSTIAQYITDMKNSTKGEEWNNASHAMCRI